MTSRTLRPAALVRTAERVSKLQLVDESLDRPVGLSLGETCSYRFEVLLQARGEAPHRGSFRRPRFFEPPVELPAFESRPTGAAVRAERRGAARPRSELNTVRRGRVSGRTQEKARGFIIG